MWEYKKPIIVKTISEKKNRVGILTFGNFETYHKTEKKLKLYSTSLRIEIQTNDVNHMPIQKMPLEQFRDISVVPYVYLSKWVNSLKNNIKTKILNLSLHFS